MSKSKPPIKFSFNSSKLIPSIKDYGKIILSVMFTVYVVKDILIDLFPVLGDLSKPWDLVVNVLLIIYLKDLFDIRIGKNKRDYF